MERRGFLQGLAALFVPATITQKVNIEDIQKENDELKICSIHDDILEDYSNCPTGSHSISPNYLNAIYPSGTYTPFTITNDSGNLSDIL